jgi:hypothetical protein
MAPNQENRADAIVESPAREVVEFDAIDVQPFLTFVFQYRTKRKISVSMS